jgi:hypothetical protein
VLGDFLVLAITHQALVAALDKFLGRQTLHRAQRILQGFFQRLRRGARISVGATQRLTDDAVNQAQRFQPVGGNPQRLGGNGGPLGAFPENLSATLGRDHLIG